MKLLDKRLIAGFAVLLGAGTLLRAEPDHSRGEGRAFEISAKIHELEDQVQSDLRHVSHLRQVARKERDVIKLTCVNNIAVQLKAQANIFESSQHELELLASSQGGDINHGIQAMTDAASACQKSREEADRCVGEPELATESSNGYTGPDFPDDPTKGDPFAPPVEPPGYASPFN